MTPDLRHHVLGRPLVGRWLEAPICGTSRLTASRLNLTTLALLTPYFLARIFIKLRNPWWNVMLGRTAVIVAALAGVAVGWNRLVTSDAALRKPPREPPAPSAGNGCRKLSSPHIVTPARKTRHPRNIAHRLVGISPVNWYGDETGVRPKRPSASLNQSAVPRALRGLSTN